MNVSHRDVVATTALILYFVIVIFNSKSSLQRNSCWSSIRFNEINGKKNSRKT